VSGVAGPKRSNSTLSFSDDLRYLDSLQGSGIRPGLNRMRVFLRAAGHPEKRYPSVIVAGTNGKGSTAATLEAILSESGYRTGLYTSPHLIDLRERWRIGRENVSRSALSRSIARLREIAADAGAPPTYFEALTLLAFILFDEEACDVAVLEVGMGGRLDATNVVTPVAALISPIGLDHTEYLGTTFRKIAFEKAGVIHRGSIALTSNRDPVVLDVIEKRCRRFGVPLHEVQRECKVSRAEVGRDRLRFRLTTPSVSYPLDSPLVGEHQIENVMLAVRGAEVLREAFPRIDRRSIARGVSSTAWRGRLERMQLGTTEVWVDGAHNAHAARRIAGFIESSIPAPRTLVFGIMADKDVHEVAHILFPLFDRVIVTRADPARGAGTALLQSVGEQIGLRVDAAGDPPRAIRRALAGAPRAVLVCGSLYLAGSALGFLDRLRRR
jgi:dihydrofolate synthase / folylpolyglutamate synthase